MESSKTEAHHGRLHTKHEHGLSSLSTFILCTVFLYIISHAFNVSPSVLIQTSRFWFLISNALILIIAIDSGLFSSSSSSSRPIIGSVHDHLVHTINPYEPASVFNQEAARKSSTGTIMEQERMEKNNQVTVVESQFLMLPQKTIEDHEQEKRVVKEKSPPPTSSNTDGVKAYDHEKWSWEQDEFKAGSCRRSKSERIIRVINVDENEKILQRSPTDEKCHDVNNIDDDDDQFSSMSNEELNKRVEEFIRNFKKQQFRVEGRVSSRNGSRR